MKILKDKKEKRSTCAAAQNSNVFSNRLLIESKGNHGNTLNHASNDLGDIRCLSDQLLSKLGLVELYNWYKLTKTHFRRRI